LREQLRFRGGTALNKLHFPAPIRYSEDIDVVRTTAGPIGPVLDRVRERLEPWFGHANFVQGPVAPKLRFRTQAEDADAAAPILLKVEINTAEIDAYDAPQVIPFRVENPWFTGNVNIPTFSREEILATKLRALLQRDKGTRSLRSCPRSGRIRGLEHRKRGRVLRPVSRKIGTQDFPCRSGSAHVRQAY
jgi:predicted nucleotidyltransferase component of viral defense system